MGHIPHNMTEQELGDLLLPYVENENNKVNILTYHEDFIIGLVQKNFSIFTLRENMNWNNNKKGALNLFDSSAKGMHNVDQNQELA